MAASPVIRILPGGPESAAAARQATRELLGDNHPAADTAILLVSELVTNSVLHSQSRRLGGTVTVALCAGATSVLIQVRDDGGPSAPQLLTAQGTAEDTTMRSVHGAGAECDRISGDDSVTAGGEHGYGLRLVDSLAETWGTIVTPDGRVTWCRLAVQRLGEEVERCRAR
jgi:anti-sigma regulatory factor (Ser/Thr protein kinase)